MAGRPEGCSQLMPLLLLLIVAHFNGSRCTSTPDIVDPVARTLQRVTSGSKRIDLVVFNRVPKTASTSLQRYIDELGQRLRFSTVHRSHAPGLAQDCAVEDVLREQLQHQAAQSRPCTNNSLIHDLTSAMELLPLLLRHRRCIIDFHFPFVHWSQVDAVAEPLYISMVREPVARIISHYEYSRNGPRSWHLKRYHHRTYGNLDINECLALYRSCGCEGDCLEPTQLECTQRKCQDLFESFNVQMMYFCPWGEPACKHKDRAALQQALLTLHHEYEAVGVLEQLSDSLDLLQLVLPWYFRNGADAGEDEGAKVQMPTLRSNTKKGPRSRLREEQRRPTPETLEALRQLNGLDIEFYEAAVQLLQRRLAAAAASLAVEELRALKPRRDSDRGRRRRAVAGQ